MASVTDVFNAAMSFMDELSDDGSAQTADTLEYKNRTPSIVNMMLSEYNMLMGNSADWLPAEDLDSFLRVDTNYALGVMPYGLAANLLVDENPTAANFYQQRYEDMRNRYMSHHQADSAEIENLYGGIEHGEFSRW